MVMIGCSDDDYKWNTHQSITTTTPILMVPTEAPAPTITISPTHIPTPTMSYAQGQEQVIDTLITFNKIHNDFVILLTTIAFFQEQRVIPPEAAVGIILPALDVYENALTSWQSPEFEDFDWIQVNQILTNMREAELEKTNIFKILSNQLQDAYLQQDINQIKLILQRINEFGKLDITKKTYLLQYQLLKELRISPDKVNFPYLEEMYGDFESMAPSIFNKLSYENLSY